jgi:DNA polymerase (family 10)
MSVVPPELREARWEFAWAESGYHPQLIERSDIRGDLHMHTTTTDGSATLVEMIEAARQRGLAYIAITDHSKRVAMARGLDGERLAEQWAEITALQTRYPDIRVLKGVECDILENGEMDLPDEVLAGADWVMASIHYGQNQSRQQITDRIIRAIRNPFVSAISHPTGRLLNRRKPYDVDLGAVLEAAREHSKLVELNSNPYRLDLDDSQVAMAREKGVLVVINTDAHATGELDALRYGIVQARRGGLEPQHVGNTRTWDELRQLVGTGR